MDSSWLSRLRRARRHLAHDGDGHGERTLRGVPADEGNAELLREIEEAFRELAEPLVVHGGDGERERRPVGHRAHGRDVGQVDRQGFVTNGFGVSLEREMDAGDKGVGAQDQLFSVLDPHYCRVVADSEYYIVTHGTGVPLQQLNDFTLTHGPSGAIYPRGGQELH